MASARALRYGKAVIELSLLSKDVEKNLKRLEAKMQNFGKALSSVGSAGLKFSAAITAPLLGAVKLAADAREEFAKFESVFGDQTDAANKFAESLAGSIGRSATDIRQGMNAFQGFFVGLGFGSEEARKFTEQLQTLSHDFAAFHNLSDQEAMERFISALSGSSEVLDKFGVNTRQAALEQVLMAKGINKSWTAVTEQEKAVARLEVIMKAMTDQGAVGAAVRESGSFANQLKGLQGQMKDIGITIGGFLLPKVTSFLAELNKISARVGQWATESGDLVRSVGAATVNIGLMSGGLVVLGKTLETVAKAARLARMAIVAMAANPHVTAITALAGAVAYLKTQFDEATDAAERLRKEGSAALDGMALDQLQSMKGSLEWKVFFEKLDYRQLHDEALAGKRSEAERALAAVNNEIEALQAKQAETAAMEDAKAKSSHHPEVPFVNQPTMTTPKAPLELPKTWKRWINDAADELKDRVEAVKIRPNLLMTDPVRWLELKAKEVQAAVAGFAGKGQAISAEGFAKQSEAMFDTRFAAQIYGGGQDASLQVAKQQLAVLNKIERKDGGIAVV